MNKDYRLVYVEWVDSYGCSPDWMMNPAVGRGSAVVACGLAGRSHDYLPCNNTILRGFAKRSAIDPGRRAAYIAAAL